MLCDTAKDREFKFLNHIIVQIQIIGPEVTSYCNLNASVVIAVAFHCLTYRRGTPWFFQPAFYQPFQQWGLLPWPMPNTTTKIVFFHPNLSYFCQSESLPYNSESPGGIFCCPSLLHGSLLLILQQF